MDLFPRKFMKTKFKALSLGLASAMAISTVAPVFAADTQNIQVFYDESETAAKNWQYANGSVLKNVEVYKQGAYSLAGIKVVSGDVIKEVKVADELDGMTGKLPNGTVFTFDVQSTSGTDVLYLSTSNLVDDFKIILDTEPASYVGVGNSGRLDANNNEGEDQYPTCSVSGSGTSVHGGESLNLTFTPNLGLQIKKLNIRFGHSNKSNVVAVKDGVVSVEGVPVKIHELEDGRVSVSCQSMTSDMYVTALTTKAADVYNLQVKTDAHIDSDVTKTHITSDEASQIVFTPEPGYSVYKFVISDMKNDYNKRSVELLATGDHVYLGNQKYTIRKHLNGQIVMDLPMATTDVMVEAVSTYGNFYVNVTDHENVSSNYEEMTMVGYGEDATVILTPDSNYDITYVTISMGNYQSVRVSTNETSFTVGGKTYRMEKTPDGVVYIYLRDLRGNVQIDPSTHDNNLTLTVKTDGGVDCADEGTVKVSKGDVYQLNFVPRDGYRIEDLKIVRNGKTTTALHGDHFVIINGERCPINWMPDGRAVITLYDITADMTVSANTDYVEGNRYITKKPDNHSSIKHDARVSNYAKPGEEVTFTIEPDRGYTLSTVTIKTKTDSVTLYGNTGRFVLNNRAFYVDHDRDGKWRVHFSSLPDSVTVSSFAVKTGINIPDDPMINEDYHHAYLQGIGGGMFAPERNMTRAECVVMLSRLFYNTENIDKSYYYPGYYDTPNDVWYSEYLGWAQANGLLDGNGYFRPNDFITRAEYVDMLCRFMGADVSGYNGYSLPFTDLKNPYWVQNNYKMAAQLAYASSHGWINGYEDGSFRPNSLLKRSHVVAMTNRAVGRKPDKEFIYNNRHSLINFIDVPLNHWAYYDVMEATNNHYLYRTTNGVEGWSSYYR